MTPPTPAPAVGARARLGVLVVIDQLSADAFEARLPKTTGGIRRLVDEGTRFRACLYDAAPTLTSIGHSTLVTGTTGDVHGIVGNEWVDHETGKAVLSTEDPAYQVLGRAPKRDGTAPTWLMAPTLGESVKLADPKARVVTISAKDRASILTAGRGADAAIWFDTEQPFFTTSTFYAAQIPAWVTPTNEKLAKLLVSGAFAWGLPGGGASGQNPTPPKRDREPFAERPELQPILDGLEVDLAEAAVKALELGKDDVPDLLVVSFSGHDRTGHAFGPDAPEAIAEFGVIDRELGRLLTVLDANVGRGRYVVALSADHGVAPLPEFAKARGLDSGGVDSAAIKEVLEKEADATLGKGDWFAQAKASGLYAASPAARAKLHGLDARLRTLAKAQPGVADLLPMPSVMSGAMPGQFGDAFRKGAYLGRSPDFMIVPRPYWVFGTSDHTGHGTPYFYDRAVPLVFAGAGVKKGVANEADAIDVAPTLARLMGVPPPAATRGRVLELILR